MTDESGGAPQEPLPARLKTLITVGVFGLATMALRLYVVAVVGLAVIIMLTILGSIALSVVGRALPGETWGIVDTAVRAIAAMFGGASR